MPRKINYNIGDVFNGITIKEETEKFSGRRHFIFICVCGNEFKSSIKHVKSGHTKSCGCRLNVVLLDRNTKHGHAKRGKITPEFMSWSNIIERCYNPNCKKFQDYGGRGIKVCHRWLDDKLGFKNFLYDMGERPSLKHSIDRFPNTDGDYEPSNCRWATPKQQVRNRRITLNVEYEGEIISLAELCEQVNVNYKRVWARLNSGWTLEDALYQPVAKVLSFNKVA